jgi:hypothetical protein
MVNRALHRASRLARCVTLALSLGACARSQRAADRPPPPPVQLEIDNHALGQMRIFVLHEGQSTRVGEVAGGGSQLFILPVHVLGVTGEIRLVAEPVAAFSRYVSELLIIRPGQRVVLTVENKLDASSVAVRQ